MNAISVSECNGNLVVDSRLIADRLGIDHKNFLETVKKYQAQIEQRFGQFAFETETVENSVGAVNQVKFALLTEPQATTLMTFSRNTEQVVECKLALVEAFEKAKQVIRDRISPPQPLPTQAELTAMLAEAKTTQEQLRLEIQKEQNRTHELKLEQLREHNRGLEMTIENKKLGRPQPHQSLPDSADLKQQLYDAVLAIAKKNGSLTASQAKKAIWKLRKTTPDKIRQIFQELEEADRAELEKTGCKLRLVPKLQPVD